METFSTNQRRSTSCSEQELLEVLLFYWKYYFFTKSITSSYWKYYLFTRSITFLKLKKKKKKKKKKNILKKKKKKKKKNSLGISIKDQAGEEDLYTVFFHR